MSSAFHWYKFAIVLTVYWNTALLLKSIHTKTNSHHLASPSQHSLDDGSNIVSDIWYCVGLQTTYNQEIQQDVQANSQVHGGYASAVQPPYGAPQQTLVSGSYDQHRAAVAVRQPISNPSPEHQQMPPAAAHRPVYVSTVPSAMPPAQPTSASYSQPAVSHHTLVICLYLLTYRLTHYSICFQALEIYVKLDTLSCWLVKIEYWLWCCTTSPDVV